MSVILICGLNGSGKTTLGIKLANTLGFHFLNRVLKGGDMYEQQKVFHNFVAARTTGKIEKWLNTLSCRVIKLDGSKPIDDNVEFIKKQL